MSADRANEGGFDAWNPGVQSSIPRKYLPLASLFRPENCLIGFDIIEDRADFTGLELDELVIYRPERIAVHSLLIRITANLTVSDGERYEDLGINFRKIATDLDQRYLQPLIPAILDCYQALGVEVRERIDAKLKSLLWPPTIQTTPEKPASGLARWLPMLARSAAPAPKFDLQAFQQRELQALHDEGQAGGNECAQFCARSLAKLLTSVATKHGRIIGDIDVLRDIACGLAMNVLASKHIGEIVEAGLREAAQAAGYRLLPPQSRSVVLNTKGASAAGKSTLRPLQHALVERLDLDWRDFALISPDIWRKYLLDYDALGEAWRYAGSLSGLELRVVDHKLDLYMATRNRQQRSPHLLIDRFRFDSFQLTSENKGEERLLTRFGDEIYMMFMVTPPAELVERAWKRGLEVGRFKPVDDLLDHCVEAYRGMPPLFFRWACRTDKRVHYEFLDNSVPKGERPLTIAFGMAGCLVVFSIRAMLDVSRYARIDIKARQPDELWASGDPYQPKDCAFLRQCAERLTELNFASQDTGEIYAQLNQGNWQILNSQLWQEALAEPAHVMALSTLGALPDQPTANPDDTSLLANVELDELGATLGRWGPLSP